jgi:catechol 2,3-dioxygenase-like lactoylglutathione lyase family enzyme
MWGSPPFSIADNCAIDVRNLSAAREWYKHKLGFREAKTDREDDSGRPFADLYLSNADTFVTLVELEPGTFPEDRHIIFYAKNLEKVREWLARRGVAAQPITADSGGNRLFLFRDLEGSPIEVCIEP